MSGHCPRQSHLAVDAFCQYYKVGIVTRDVLQLDLRIVLNHGRLWFVRLALDKALDGDVLVQLSAGARLDAADGREGRTDDEGDWQRAGWRDVSRRRRRE